MIGSDRNRYRGRNRNRESLIAGKRATIPNPIATPIAIPIPIPYCCSSRFARLTKQSHRKGARTQGVLFSQEGAILMLNRSDLSAGVGKTKQVRPTSENPVPLPTPSWRCRYSPT
jgi:hypothetical protein